VLAVSDSRLCLTLFHHRCCTFRYRLHQKELDSIRNADKRHRRLVELNVIEQCINVYKTGVVQRRRVETYQEGQEFTTPRIHGLVFDPKDGRLIRLNVSKCFMVYSMRECLHHLS
jgi:carbonic anhydrase